MSEPPTATVCTDDETSCPPDTLRAGAKRARSAADAGPYAKPATGLGLILGIETRGSAVVLPPGDDPGVAAPAALPERVAGAPDVDGAVCEAPDTEHAHKPETMTARA